MQRGQAHIGTASVHSRAGLGLGRSQLTQVRAPTSSEGPRGVASSNRVTGTSHVADRSRMAPESATNSFSKAWTCACAECLLSQTHVVTAVVRGTVHCVRHCQQHKLQRSRERLGRTAKSVHWNEFQRLLRLSAGTSAFMTPGRATARAAALRCARDRLHSACFARSCAGGCSPVRACVQSATADQSKPLSLPSSPCTRDNMQRSHPMRDQRVRIRTTGLASAHLVGRRLQLVEQALQEVFQLLLCNRSGGVS